MVFQMLNGAVQVVGEKRAADATFFPAWAEHEVINNQLAAALKEVGKRFFAVPSLEGILLLNLFPRQVAALPAQLITQMGKFLFLAEKFLSCGCPFS
jgi:hypothetical protein